MPEPAAVSSMFGRIARHYDAANRAMTAGVDRRWRRRLVAEAVRSQPRTVLDLATGSGDVAYALAATLPVTCNIIAADFCAPMLVEAERKRAAHGNPPAARLQFVEADALKLPFRSGQFDAVTIAFGLRNLADRALGLQEMRRVLAPGGRLLVLESSQPSRWIRPFYRFYVRHVVPRLGGRLTGDADAYRYLNLTMEAFPGRAALEREILAAGFSEVKSCPLAGGAVAIHVAAR